MVLAFKMSRQHSQQRTTTTIISLVVGATAAAVAAGVYFSRKKRANTVGTEQAKTPFQEWMKKSKTTNGGKKTTLKQEFELALDLYQQAYPSIKQQQTVDQIIRMVENTPIHDTNSIVSWSGIKVDWFLNVFCKSPFMKVLIDYGCEVWFIRKICMIEIVRQTSKSKSGDPPDGIFVENIHSVVKGWNLEGSQDITSIPTTFISYTGAYTMEHVVQVLANLDPQMYIWMDIFCVNQFAWTGKGRTPEMRKFRDAFMDDLQNQIEAIGSTTLILEKWDNVMLTLGKMWVLWEIFNTAKAEVDLQVLLTPEQRDSFIANCLESPKEFKTIQSSLAAINANDAVTDDDIDRQFILERMQREDKNLVQVNTAVLEEMRNWLADEGLNHLSLIQSEGESPSISLLNNLGTLLNDQGRLEEAEQLFRNALETFRQALGNQHKDTLTSIHNLGSLLQAQGRLDEAEPLLREALATKRDVMGDQHPNTLTSINNLGALLRAQGKLEDAEPLLREALKIKRQVLGDQHPESLSSINNLGMLLEAQGNLDEAESLLREALEARRKVLGDRHQDTLISINNLGSLLLSRGNLLGAESLLKDALEPMREVLGDVHPNTLTTMSNLGGLLHRQGKLHEAEKLLRETLKTKRRVLGDQHPDTLISMHNLADVFLEQPAKPHLQEARSLMLFAVAISIKKLGLDHQFTRVCLGTAVLKGGFLILENGELQVRSATL